MTTKQTSAATIYDYRTGEEIRPASAEEWARYAEQVGITEDDYEGRESGAVPGDEYGCPGRTVYMVEQ